MDISNEQGLITAMEIAAREALELTADDVLEKFKKDYLRKYVYASPESHAPNTNYYDKEKKPTYQFEAAWKWTEMRKQVMTLSKEMFYDPSEMEFNADTFLHGSAYSTPNDVRDNLPAILEGKQSSLWLSVPRPIKFWVKFLEDMFANGELSKIIEKRFLEKGFVKI